MEPNEEDMYNNLSDYDYDENEIDWNETLYELEPDEEDIIDDNETDISDESDDIDDSEYKTPNLTEKYIKQQLNKLEFKRDKIKFYYKNEVTYGLLLSKSNSGKYIFECTDLSTGEKKLRCLDGDYIDSYTN